MLVLELCVFCFGLLLVLSPCSVWLQFLPACMLLPQLANSLYLCVFVTSSDQQRKRCVWHVPVTYFMWHVWVFLNLVWCVNSVHFFMVFCAFLTSLWFWVIFFPHFCDILSQFWVELRHGCLQASVENIMKEKMPKKGGRWWFSWRSRNNDIKSVRSLISRHNCSQQCSFMHYIKDNAPPAKGWNAL